MSCPTSSSQGLGLKKYNEQAGLEVLHSGGGRNYHPLSENRDFSGTETPLDLRPVCKLNFVRCGPVEKKQSALSFSV